MQNGKLIGQGRTAEIFEINEDKIVKLFRPDFPLPLIENEFKITKSLINKKLPIPGVFELLKIEDRFGIVYEKIIGTTMMNIISTKPWRIKSEAKRLAELHKSIQVNVNEDIPNQDFRIKKNIQETDYLNNNIKAKLIDYIDKLPKGEILCHGDFHPDNIIISKNKVFVIDWMAATYGNPLSDVARTSIIFKFGIVPEHESSIKSIIINYIRKRYYNEYIQHYLRISGQRKELIEQWEAPIAAARLVETIPLKEKEMLLKFVTAHFS